MVATFGIETFSPWFFFFVGHGTRLFGVFKILVSFTLKIYIFLFLDTNSQQPSRVMSYYCGWITVNDYRFSLVGVGKVLSKKTGLCCA